MTAFEITKVSTKGQDSLSTKYAWHTALTTSGNNSTSCGRCINRPSASALDLPDLFINLKSYEPNTTYHIYAVTSNLAEVITYEKGLLFV